MAIEYMLAQDGTELAEKLYCFRYRIYRYEVGVSMDGYAEDRMRDLMDEVALNYVAVQEGNIIGSLRICDLVRMYDYSSIAKKYNLQMFRTFFRDQEISHVSRLAIGISARRSPVMVRLFEYAIREGRTRNIRVTFADCSPHHLPLYVPIGYTPYGNRFLDPVFGEKSPILWVTGDLELLRARRSPLLKVCEKFGDDPEARSWFHQNIPEDAEREFMPQSRKASSVSSVENYR
jgi:hypothetical protein